MKAIAALLLLLAIQAQAQVSLLVIPIATNSPAATNAVFWNSNPPPTSIVAWQLTQLLATNFNLIQAALNGPVQLSQLPAAVVTNDASGSLLTSNATFTGTVNSTNLVCTNLSVSGPNNSSVFLHIRKNGGADYLTLYNDGSPHLFYSGYWDGSPNFSGTPVFSGTPQAAGLWLGSRVYATAGAPLTTIQGLWTTFAWNGSNGSTINSYSYLNAVQLDATINHARMDVKPGSVNGLSAYYNGGVAIGSGAGSSTLPPANSLTVSATATATNGFILPQLSAIPTNSIPGITAGATNWVLLNLTNTINGGGPMYCATNPAVVGGFQFLKPTYTATTWP